MSKGIIIILVGIGMFMLGLAVFSYSGPTLDPFISDLGKYSFFLWLPTTIVGVEILRRSKRLKKDTPNNP